MTETNTLALVGVRNEDDTENDAVNQVEGDTADVDTSDADANELPTLTESELQLSKIRTAELEVCQKERAVDDLKEDLKVAKAEFDLAVSKMRALVRANENDKNRPLLHGLDDNEDDANNPPTPPTDPNAWKSIPITDWLASFDTKGFGGKKKEAFTDQFAVLLDFEDKRVEAARSKTHLCHKLPKGIGERLADEIEESFLNFKAKFDVVTSGESPTPDRESGSDTTTSNDFEPSSVAIENRNNFIIELMQEIKASDTYQSRTNEMAWDEGKQAYTEGCEATECPMGYSPADMTDWLRGWMSMDQLVGENAEAEAEATD